MDCEFCRKNIKNLIDNNLTKEQKSEMINHIKGCESCGKKYNYEKKIHDDFKSVLHDYDPGFVSSRKTIMSKIDNEKYPLSFGERMGYKMKRNKGIVAAAAVIIIAVSASAVVIPKLINGTETADVKLSTQAGQTSTAKNEKEEANKPAETEKDTSVKNPENETQTAKDPVKSLNMFTKDVPTDSVINSMTKESQTPWEDNKENNYSACVLGKGEHAEEEGYASLIIKSDKGSITEYKLIDEQKSQTTIVQTEWIDKDRILVITGAAYGTVVSGQKIYSINIHDDSTKLVFEPEAKTQRIKKMESKGDGYLEITLAQYTDDSLNEYKETIKTIRI